MSVSDGHVFCATAAHFRTKCWTVSALSRPPRAVGNRILVPSSSPCSLIHAVSTMTEDLANGVHRSLRPFPSHRICAPLPRLTSWRRIEVISERLNHGQEERMIAATQPCILVWSRQECIDLRPSEETHKRTRLAFVGNREHALDQPRVLGGFQRNIAKKRPNRSQSQITTPCPVRTSAFQVIQKHSQKRRL